MSTSERRKRPRPTTSSDSSSSSSSSAASAFHAALQAEVATGATVAAAVESLFNDATDDIPTASRHRLRSLDLAAPVLSALRTSPQLADDLATVARMCQAVYELAEDELDALRTPRKRLQLGLNGVPDVARLIEEAENVVVLTGAGVSVSCGIPDFRSKGGLYDTVLERFGLTDPQAIFDLEEFRMDPTLFYSFAKDVMPGKELKPSLTHCFVAELEKRGKLLRNYSQNIDGLERRAGVSEEKVILCHGSFLTATCMRRSCRQTIPGSDIAEEVARGVVPICRQCGEEEGGENEMDAESRGVLKPDIVFFGENLPRSVGDNLENDVAKADLLLVLGTSLQVAPVARIPQYFRDGVPRILVNRELVAYDFDVELLGDCDVVVEELKRALKWTDKDGKEEKEEGKREQLQGSAAESGSEKGKALKVDDKEEVAVTFRPPRRFLFPGAAERFRVMEDESEESELVVPRGEQSGEQGDTSNGLVLTAANGTVIKEGKDGDGES